MSVPPRRLEPEQTRAEEIANSISHGMGLIAAIVASVFLIVQAVERADWRFTIGATIFAATMALLYFASTFYHALPAGRAKRVLRVVEHSAIFLLIAGTYTPFTLGVLRGAWGWTLFGLVWALALVGVALKVCDRLSRPIFSTGLYLLMGWLILIAINPLLERLPTSGLLWLIAGGVAYTAGVVFYVTDARLRFGHFIWHLFVIAGTSCHYFAVLWYAV